MEQRHKQPTIRDKVVLGLMMMTALAALWFDQEAEETTPSILAAIPSQFDLRVLPSYKLVDFTVREEGVCVGSSWALALTQTLSDLMTLKYNETLSFSAQDLLECTTDDQSLLCHSTDQARIEQAIARLKNIGVATSACYPFNPLLSPKKCATRCPSNNQTITRTTVKTVSEVNKDITSVTNQIGNYGPIVAILEYRDSLNYYNSGVVSNTGELYGSLAMEIIGWKDQGHILVAKGNFGTSWGMNGYMQIALNDPTLKKLYAFSVSSTAEETVIA